MVSTLKYRPSFGHFALVFVTATCLFSNAIAHPQTEEESRERIQKLISKTFDRPDLKVQTDPIVIEGKVAIADWIQGKRAVVHFSLESMLIGKLLLVAALDLKIRVL